MSDITTKHICDKVLIGSIMLTKTVFVLYDVGEGKDRQVGGRSLR